MRLTPTDWNDSVTAVRFPATQSCAEGERVAIVDSSAELLALRELRGDHVYPKQVFITVHGADTGPAR